MVTVGEQQDAIAEQMAKYRLTAEGHDVKPVPVGGQYHTRVPESMRDAVLEDWRLLPVAQVEVLCDYGREHDNLVQLRKDLEQVKRSIDSVGPLCESRVRFAEKLRGDGLSEDKQTMLMMQDEDARKKRDAVFESIHRIVDGIEDTEASSYDTTKGRMRALVEEVRERGSRDFETKEAFSEYWSFCRMTTQKMFAENKKLMERIKDIKRAHHKAQSAEVAKAQDDARAAQDAAPAAAQAAAAEAEAAAETAA